LSSACGQRAPHAAHPPEPTVSSVLGRFHEISIATADIRASVEFYERLGFTQAPTTDAWSHPYGVLTDGRLFIGLHQRRGPTPAITFVLPGIATHLSAFESLGIPLTTCRTGDEVFNEIGFLDPFGQAVSVLEARTYSPVAREPSETSLCGYFGEVSMPARNFETAKVFWEPLGFVATDEAETPYVHLSFTSDHLDIGFHRPRTFDVPLLVFRDPEMPARIAQLRDQGTRMSDSVELPRGFDPESNALIESPDGTLLLLLHDES
jgi:catechol 2,3-dioxygenase-like lactoylglutathione lyase family enzyme